MLEEANEMDRTLGIAAGVLGFSLMIASVISFNLPEVSKWSAGLLIGGAGLLYLGIKKYRVA
jgi:predicted cobalt transporter CbtA